MPRISMIGAGSCVFAKNLMGDMLNFPALKDCEFSLMDIDPERLEVAEKMTRKLIAQLGGTGSVSATLDRREALKDVDYVVNMVQVGGFAATLLDFDIPEKYGLKATIADTIGVGGVMRGLRTIPVVVDICRDMEEICPDALLMNYSNPMAMNVWAASEETSIRNVGLCHGIRHTARMLAKWIGAEWENITYRVGGINHMAWFMDFMDNGEDAYPRLWDAIDEGDKSIESVRIRMMKQIGYFMTESSEHLAEYLPYFIQHEEWIDPYKIPIREYVRRCENLLGRFDDMKTSVESDEPFEVRTSGEYCSEIINAIETGKPFIFNGNVMNYGLIPNLPEGCCVEVPCAVDRNGIQPSWFGALPPQCAALCRTNINVQELTVRAALDGSREHVYHAVMLDPHTASVLDLDRIVSMCDELIEAHNANGCMPPLD